MSEKLDHILKDHKASSSSSEHVFTKTTGGYITRSSFRKQFFNLTEKAGVIRIRFHDIRHLFATQLKRQGWDVKVAQELLGHSDPRITLEIYQHNESDETRQAVNSLFPGLGKVLDERQCGQRTVKRGNLQVIK